jgi:hypothetical protein
MAGETSMPYERTSGERHAAIRAKYRALGWRVTLDLSNFAGAWGSSWDDDLEILDRVIQEAQLRCHEGRLPGQPRVPTDPVTLAQLVDLVDSSIPTERRTLPLIVAASLYALFEDVQDLSDWFDYKDPYANDRLGIVTSRLYRLTSGAQEILEAEQIELPWFRDWTDSVLNR